MAQKSFKDNLTNPALSFISEASIKAEDGGGQEQGAQQSYQQKAKGDEAAAIPLGYKRNPLYVETKSRRLQLLVTPTLYGQMKEEAQRRGISINALANAILEEGSKKYSDDGGEER